MEHNQSGAESCATNDRRVLRRDFLRLAVGAGAWAGGGFSFGAAGEREDWGRFIPLEKHLRKEWVDSLAARGTPATYAKSRGELRYIGMPVGGICCGTLYLGGDGRLWNWDIFNKNGEGVLPVTFPFSEIGADFAGAGGMVTCRHGARYVKPATRADSQRIAQGFAVRINQGGASKVRTLDADGWKEVEFTGQYPIGTVRYTDPESPVAVVMEAFSPFVPHQADDSSLPATVFAIRVENTGAGAVEVDIAGWLQNAVCFHSGVPGGYVRKNRAAKDDGATMVVMEMVKRGQVSEPRPDLSVADFENGYGAWRTEGDAFGKEPVKRSEVPAYQGDLGGVGDRTVNSHATAPGGSIGDKDNRKGKLTSPPIRIERRYLAFHIGGGQRDDVGLRVLLDGKEVRRATGHNNNRMRRAALDLSEFDGREVVIEIFDNAEGPWANIGVDHIIQTDIAPEDLPLDQRPDFGTMVLAAAGDGRANLSIMPGGLPDAAFADAAAAVPEGEAPLGCVAMSAVIGAGKSADFRFVLAWHFPRTKLPCPDASTGNLYAKRFADAAAVAGHVVREMPRLEKLTRLWRDTWYDSTLPHWFLDRTFANTSTLATTTAHRFGSGRFWAWEGVGCCEGTCTHVWHYAQAVARIFPEIERDIRERVDLGVGFVADSGIIRHRAEGTGPAIDGHCGRILGVWREHQMSADAGFLKRVWPRVKQAAEYIIRHDSDGDGILDGPQENTLDAAWFGQIAWITSLAIAALKAVGEMARELGENAFADQCRAQAAKAKASVEAKLYNGEYFIQLPDPQKPKHLGTYQACHIDQVHGQSWAWQVGLGRVLDRDKSLSALRALWKYNFTMDVGPFRKQFTVGRPYAMPGEGGMVMASNPRGVKDVFGIVSWQTGYFNECMSGFEHQVASHMVAEGMVTEGLAVTRAIHDRYHASRRNPYNEVECSDHYARAMASYGTFISACGFTSHGPSGRIGFAPRLTPDDFRAPFTAAGGWGTYSQKRNRGSQSHRVEVKHGRVSVRTLCVEMAPGTKARAAVVTVGETRITASVSQKENRVEIRLSEPAAVEPGAALVCELEI